MIVSRVVLVVAGVAGAAYGASLLLEMPSNALINLAVWLVAGLLAHDAIFAPASLALGHGAKYILPRPAWAPILIATVLTATVLVLSIPVISPREAGATPVNSTLLDRPYVTGLLVALAIVWILAAALVVLRLRAASQTHKNR